MNLRTTAPLLVAWVTAAACAVFAFQATYATLNWQMFQTARHASRVGVQGTFTDNQVSPQSREIIGSGYGDNVLALESRAEQFFRWGNPCGAVLAVPAESRTLALRHWGIWCGGATLFSITGAMVTVHIGRRQHRWRLLSEHAKLRHILVEKRVDAALRAAVTTLILWWPCAIPLWYLAFDRTWSMEGYLTDRATGPYETGAAFVTLLVLAAVFGHRRTSRLVQSLAHATGACSKCGYDPGHSGTDVCPECGSRRGSAGAPAPLRSTARRSTRLRAATIATGFVLAVGTVIALAPNRLRSSSLAWLTLEPSVSEGAFGVILARPDELLFLRWTEGAAMVYLERPLGPGRDASDPAVYRVISAYWPRGRPYELDAAEIHIRAYLVPSDGAWPIVIPVGLRRVVFDVRTTTPQPSLQCLLVREVRDVIRFVPGTSHTVDTLIEWCRKGSEESAQPAPSWSIDTNPR